MSIFSGKWRDKCEKTHVHKKLKNKFSNSKIRKNEETREKRSFREISYWKIEKNKKTSKNLLTSQNTCVIIRSVEKNPKRETSKTEENARSTFMAKAETISRKWYVIDAAGKPLGKTAAAAATILRGKHRPEFTPHVDCGEFVIIINASKAVLTGKKLEQKYYRRHTGYIGGLKEVQYKTLMATKPELAMQLAVKGMLPHNKIGDRSITRLKVYAGAEHKQQAQQPITYTV